MQCNRIIISKDYFSVTVSFNQTNTQFSKRNEIYTISQQEIIDHFFKVSSYALYFEVIC